jgi:ureidoglycolate lyase
MPLTSSTRIIPVTNLSPTTFAPFGEVIQNPSTHEEIDGNGQWRLSHIIANQGTATKWLDVTHMTNWYNLAASKKPAKCVVNMFVCRPRELDVNVGSGGEERKCFGVRVLERHPFTPQTFIPVGVAGKQDAKDRRYLVVVAPTLPASPMRTEPLNKPYPAEKPPSKKKKKSLKEKLLDARPNLFTNDYAPSTTPAAETLPVPQRPKGTGLPDLQNVRAFIARGDQAVTYGPGTWHAPMVVLGQGEIDFVVVQYANGVGVEDCQEVEILPEESGGMGLVVDVGGNEGDGTDGEADRAEASKAGYMRAKL